MKLLIAYGTRYGTTAACARALADAVRAETVVADLARRPRPRPGEYDAVLVGGSIYAGRIQRAVTTFCESFEEELLARPLGLFVCCFFQGERARAQIADAFPASLHEHAFARMHVGGALNPAGLSLFDRFLVRSLGAGARAVDLVKGDQLAALAAAVNALPGPA